MFDAQSPHQFREFPSRTEWARSIAMELILDLGNGLAGERDVAMVVPGGRTPAPVFAELANADLPWSRVHLCPTDERWVRPDDTESNERSIIANLIDKGAGAKFHSLWRNVPRPSDGLAEVERSVASMPRPFSAVLVGMGEDGHFASLFPGSAKARAALDSADPRSCVAIDAPKNGYPRMSLTLSALTDSARTCLAIMGREKRDILASAIGRTDFSLPISLMLAQDRAPIHVFWAP